jgi:hypothetical protein
MSAPASPSLRRIVRLSGLTAAAALALSVALGCLAPPAAAPAYRFAVFACLQPAVGSLIFCLIYRITGGQWGEALESPFAAGIRLLPWIWPLVVPLLFWPQARPALEGPLPPFLGPGALLLRAVFYEAVFLAAGRVALSGERRRLAAPALIVLVFTLHVLAADWFFTLDPGWYSTGFPLVWMSIQAAAGLALALAFAPLCGRSPAEVGAAGRPLGADWGNLLLTTVILSSYLAFIQYLVIWSGNLPREIAWFERRLGPWRWVAVGLALFHLFLPMAFALSHRWKTSPRGIPRLAAFLCVIETAWAAWFILPPFGSRGALAPVLSAAALVGGAALLLNRYLTSILRHAPAGEGAP